ncbi:MAG TPA: VOC family protein [Thermoleophilia bacterium]|nr:VOC family protein [Thermoleophilia bacterium]
MMAGLAETMIGGVVRAESYDRAKKFYTEVLGLKQGMEFPGPGGGGMFEGSGGTMVMVYENPSLKAPENTTLAFGVAVDRFAAVMEDLRSRGVVFEEYDIPEMGVKTVNGVAEFSGMKSAWFKDTEGNILNLAAM